MHIASAYIGFREGSDHFGSYKQMLDFRLRGAHLSYILLSLNLVSVAMFTVNDAWKQLIFMYAQYFCFFTLENEPKKYLASTGYYGRHF
jgi:hypothetical protein